MIQAKCSGKALAGFLVAFSGLLVATPGISQSLLYQGELGPGDTKLGKYFDTYPLQLSSGDRIVATLRSADFDAYLHVEAPDGTEVENDDYGEGSDARLDVIAHVSGIWKVKVTTYEEQEDGQYLLVVNRERLEQYDAWEAALAEEDPTSVKGEYYDRYSIEVEPGQRIVICMQSEQIDTFLVLKPPHGQVMINDDYLTENESRIDYVAETAGIYELYATSYRSAEQGPYSLRVLLGGRMKGSRLDGYLDAGDPQLEDYGYYDLHALFLRQGEHVIIEMTSDDFDTFLAVEGPNGFYEENDDYNELTHISRLELFAEAEGEYRIFAASYEAAASGSYALKIYSSRDLSRSTIASQERLSYPVRVEDSARG
jgi:hypothetical protein